MSSRNKVLFGIFGFDLASIFAVVLIFGWTRRDNEEFQPQNEFKLDTWIELPGPLDFNKAVMYLLIAAILTCGTMIWIARRMQARPNRVQTAVEALFSLMRDNITRGNMDSRMAAKWFPFIGALFLFIWFSNLIGYIPLPTNTHEKFELFGVEIPAFALYAATANISVPLVLALVVFVAYNVEGIRTKGLIGYLKSLVPTGVKGAMAAFIFVLEFLGVFTLPFGIILFLFEVGLVATLQAFIFATLTAIYLGGAVAEHH